MLNMFKGTERILNSAFQTSSSNVKEGGKDAG